VEGIKGLSGNVYINCHVGGSKEHSALAGREDNLTCPYQQKYLLLHSFLDYDCIIADNARLETGSLEQQLLLSYNATEIRGLVEKLVAVNPAKSQWRINNKVNYFNQ
jgi:hypothetical protein